jgi:hypothetical protein
LLTFRKLIIPYFRKDEDRRLDQMAAAQAEREKALEQIRLAQDEREKTLRRRTTCSCRRRRIWHLAVGPSMLAAEPEQALRQKQ